jgi:hypothetical protein
MIAGERKPDPVLDPWMRDHGLLVDAPPRKCPECHGRGGFWVHEMFENSRMSKRMLWHWCACEASPYAKGPKSHAKAIAR